MGGPEVLYMHSANARSHAAQADSTPRCQSQDERPYGARATRAPFARASISSHKLARLSRGCKGDHEHQHIEGKERTSNAASYPPALIVDILRGVTDERDARDAAKERA